ncbi:hypothetical protein SPRG_22199 [Saprolegnia parasitica CBS 223.65]|uniref:Uncharacterized protein n=1 Tax=Saprolegnia parasitica (strain CBS 223.65) TaxID=695850 RepID=A0A067CF17_SAPPC|nr:hypothetical protein SPRG_22199 [Saprolegnia parasitica CBS 223.65]KDO27750.1 hypothetical protein SPRG_22199 [Saprolegnia parasitica CBS 223.65]|eukprot:XP_012201633.1 hypothetical protein SPRG_22199 [Saprolegnia parasitica CBS 223.65]
MDADALHALVRSFLEASHRRSNQGDDDVDDAIVVYVAQVVADQDVEAQQAAECICALSPCADADDALAMVLDGRAITRALAHESNQPARFHAAVAPSKTVTSENNELETLQWLKELAPQLSLRSIETIYLQECRGDAARTAEYLVTHYGADETKYLSLSTLQATDLRDKILTKYSDEEIKAPVDPKAKPAKVKVKVKPPPKEGLVRYLEGKVVTTKGHKFVEEKKPTYDGGSRGRVKTKGKRGKGFADG